MRNYSRHITSFWMRNTLILGQVLVWIMTRYIWNIEYPHSVLLLTALYFCMNVIFYILRHKNTDVLIFLQLLIDVAELSVFFYLTGGSSNPFTWFLLIPIIFSATVLKQKYTWALTLLAIVSYTLLIKYFQPVSMDMSMHHGHHQASFSQHLIGMWLGFIVIAALIAWVIIGLVKNIRSRDALLMAANIRQAENDKILALATLATGSAHELGTPLATINIIIREMLNDETISNYHKQLSIMESQVYRCKESLTQITASTGTTQAIKGKKISVSEFIDKIVKQVQPPPGLQLNANISGDISGLIISDRTLNQALINIIRNSYQAESTQVDLEARIFGNNLKFIIADDGKGLQAEFGKPVESEKEFGMGLGLFLAHATIERFSGTVEITANSPKGTKIEITLPLVTE